MKQIRLCCIMMLFVCSCMFIFNGCSKKAPELLSGAYIMAGHEEDVNAPVVKFNTRDKTFMFSFDPLSSYINMGTIKLNGNKVIAKTDDGMYKYVFRIIDKETIQFVRKVSASTNTAEGKEAVPDKTKFTHVEVKSLD